MTTMDTLNKEMWILLYLGLFGCCFGMLLRQAGELGKYLFHHLATLRPKLDNIVCCIIKPTNTSEAEPVK